MLDDAVGDNTLAQAIQSAVDIACKRIAPTWPLDQYIAVNPYWGFVKETVNKAASQLASYSGSQMLMPRDFYRQQSKFGSFNAEHLREALQHSGSMQTITEVQDELARNSPAAPLIPLMTSIADSRRDLRHGLSINDFLKHNVSQHCASYFDHSQSSWQTQHKTNLYQGWLHHASRDMSPWLLMGLHGVRRHARTLPTDSMSMISLALGVLPVPRAMWPDYLTALLMNINGWASWCSFERWQANLNNKNDDHIVQLLAVRLAWEHFAFVHLLESKELSSWKLGWKAVCEWQQQSLSGPATKWIFQEALEVSYQTTLCTLLKTTSPAEMQQEQVIPSVQAVFCIDVRSEVLRRALEECSTSIQTLGFAGFFGLPISYTPLGTKAERPQLPGLLSPKLRVTETTCSQPLDKQSVRRRQRSLQLKSIWKDFRSSATSTFTFVESCGLFYSIPLLKRTMPGLKLHSQKTSAKTSPMRPCLFSDGGQNTPPTEDLSELVAGILTNMSLTSGFSRLLLLIGHGSQTINNPHAAGLDCGACGGQTGEVNARFLADLLNDPSIRAGLVARGIVIPHTTYVLPALHNTTTDEVTIFDTNRLPESHAADLVRLRSWLQEAGHRARTERAASVGIKKQVTTSQQTLLEQFQIRSRDWSQVRPEWGLANNAAFLIAPRTRSRGLDLQGRVFLHEYRSASDPDGTVLESIMTAPMIVTNWINMQYYASTVDNTQYGCGNKVLHNVVGGRLGVFEGNGGDLRIGLPLQSLHDGHTLRHTPLRLSVFIEAPHSSIDTVLRTHEVVRNLVQNGWLHLFQIAPGAATVTRYDKGIWKPFGLTSTRLMKTN